MKKIGLPVKVNISQRFKNFGNKALSVTSYYYNSGKQGWHNGKRLACIRKENAIDTFTTQVAASTKTTIKSIKPNHLPALFAGVGTITPIPFGAPLGYSLGKFLAKRLTKVKNINTVI